MSRTIMTMGALALVLGVSARRNPDDRRPMAADAQNAAEENVIVEENMGDFMRSRTIARARTIAPTPTTEPILTIGPTRTIGPIRTIDNGSEAAPSRRRRR